MKRKYCVYVVQALGLLSIAAGLYVGWVQQLAVDAAAIRLAPTSPPMAAQAAAAWNGLPQFLLVALRGPAFWLGLALIIAAPWLPIPESQGRRSDVPVPEAGSRVRGRRVPSTGRSEPGAGAVAAAGGDAIRARTTRVLGPRTPRV
jgi:hypothetical protein